jgi:gliding motility-associated protein GldM
MANAKETPRQKMIGMMYLVLTCLLALNVSRDILKGFVTVNESLERSNNSLKVSNEQMLEAFKKAANETWSAKGYYTKAVESRKLTSETVAYIEKMKTKLIAITEKVDWSVADTMQLKFVDKMDDFDTPTYQLIGSDETKLTEGEFSAKELRGKLEMLQGNLQLILDSMQKNSSTQLLEKDYQALRTKIGLMKPIDTNEKEDDMTVTWEIKNFYHLPLAAVVTNLSKMESDIKNLETEIINQYVAASGKLAIKFDRLAAKVLAPSKYIRSGEDYKANIILAGSSSDFNNDNMQVLIGATYDPITKKLINEGTSLGSEQGLGNYAMKTSGQGEQTIKGVIRFKNPKGEMEYYPFEDNYTVAQPASAVSADYMNVFYAGLPNAVSVSAAGVAPNNLVVKVNGNTAPLVSQGNGKYTISPVTTGSCEIAVYSREAGGQLKMQGAPSKFKVKPIPIPFVKLNGKYALGTYEMKKAEANILSSIAADIPGFDLNAKFKIKSFTICTLNNGLLKDEKCAGNNLTAEAKAAVNKTKAGGKIFIEDIIAIGPDKREVPLGNVTIRVKS